METEERIREAKEILDGIIRRKSRQHRSVVDEAAVNTVAKLEALKGLCGQCTALSLRIRRNPNPSVEVDCENSFIPTYLYENWFAGDVVTCKGFKERTS